MEGEQRKDAGKGEGEEGKGIKKNQMYQLPVQSLGTENMY